MAKLLKLRRGTTTQHGSFTVAEGEVTIDTTKDTAVVHDGSQAGGRPLAREDMNNVSGANIKSRLNAQITNGEVNNSAAIAGTKISPNFGSQNIQTSGTCTAGTFSGSGASLTSVPAGQLTGTVASARLDTASTQSAGNNSTKIATTAFVTTAISNADAFPSGTRMLFQQTSAPTGWTKVTSGVNNHALRVVSGTAGSGGNAAFTTVFANRGITANAGNTTATGNVSTGNSSPGGNISIANASTGGTVNSHTLTIAELPSHNHTLGGGSASGNASPMRRGAYVNANHGTSNTGGGGGHSHGFTGGSHNHNATFSGDSHSHNASFSGSAHNHSISVTNLDLAVQYLDVIIASKD